MQDTHASVQDATTGYVDLEDEELHFSEINVEVMDSL
jgi:hypothetical protein